jgi:hypothetical protein
VVSHHNKATKGRLVRALASGRTNPSTVTDLATTIEQAGFGAELHDGQPGRPASIDIVVNDV